MAGERDKGVFSEVLPRHTVPDVTVSLATSVMISVPTDRQICGGFFHLRKCFKISGKSIKYHSIFSTGNVPATSCFCVILTDL